MELENAIRHECRKLIRRHNQRLAAEREIRKRFRRATGQQAGKGQQKHPLQWDLARAFNPFKVRSSASRIAHSIKASLSDEAYDPCPALVLRLPKPAGGFRPISIFPVADAGIANYFYQRMLDRNQSRLSASSYGYRNDIGSQDAIERLWREFHEQTHYFLVEYDFSKYFDTIEHAYLQDTLRRYFKLTKTERHVVSAILRSRRAFGPEAYRLMQFKRSHRGIPQGNSLSLFLANVACHELDIEMTRAGVTFARYADDIVVLCRTRGDAVESRELIMRHCQRTGLAVNFKKSPGISEVGPQGLKQGSAAVASFQFLGYEFSYRMVQRRNTPAATPVRRLSIRESTAARVRVKLSRIIYSHLIRYPEKDLWKPTRVNAAIGIDWDLVTCINDLRGYVYGGLPEKEILGKLKDRSKPLHTARGILAYFPLVNDVEQLRQLDGWLVNALLQALRLREQVLRSRHNVTHYPTLEKEQLVSADWYDARKIRSTSPIPNDVRLPSFVRAWKYSRRGLFVFGLRHYPARGIPEDDLASG